MFCGRRGCSLPEVSIISFQLLQFFASARLSKSSFLPHTSKYFKELIFNTLLFADDQCIISDTEDNLQKVVYSLYNKSKEFNLEIATNKTKVFGFVGTDHLRAKIIINDEILEQVNQFTYLGCSLSYQCSNDVEFKLAYDLYIF